MLMLDVNVLVYAHRRDMPDHAALRQWLEKTINGPTGYGVPDLVFSGFLRIVTHPRIFRPASTLEEALTFVNEIRSQPNFLPLGPSPRHWQLFEQLCRAARVKGNLVPDAYLAALAIETGSEWITTDRDFARFPGLKWRHPLEE
jgi:toxin-antitoxin system PIN domain toxin